MRSRPRLRDGPGPVIPDDVIPDWTAASPTLRQLRRGVRFLSREKPIGALAFLFEVASSPHPVSLEEICISLRATPAVVKVWKRLLTEDKFVHIALGKSETCGRPCQYYSLTPAGYAYLISLAAKAKPQPKTPTP
jgi:hypothetical protein